MEDQQKVIEDLFEKGILVSKEFLEKRVDGSLTDNLVGKLEQERDFSNTDFNFKTRFSSTDKEISLVLPYLPLEIILALIIPNMSISAIISETRRWVSVLSLVWRHRLL